MWRLLYILLIGACSSEQGGPCRLQLVADLPVALTRNGLEVTARVNRVDTQFVPDTGAERTTLTTDTITSLLLARSKLTVSRLIGVGTISGDPAVLVHGIDGGSINVRIHRFQFMSIGQDQITSPQIGIGESQLVSPEMILDWTT